MRTAPSPLARTTAIFLLALLALSCRQNDNHPLAVASFRSAKQGAFFEQVLLNGNGDTLFRFFQALDSTSGHYRSDPRLRFDYAFALRHRLDGSTYGRVLFRGPANSAPAPHNRVKQGVTVFQNFKSETAEGARGEYTFALAADGAHRYHYISGLEPDVLEAPALIITRSLRAGGIGDGPWLLRSVLSDDLSVQVNERWIKD